MTAQTIEAGTAETGTGSVHESVVRQDAPDYGLGITIPHNPLSVQLSKAVIIGLLPVCILAFCTRPTAAVGSASIHKPYGPAPTAHASTDGVSGKVHP